MTQGGCLRCLRRSQQPNHRAARARPPLVQCRHSCRPSCARRVGRPPTGKDWVHEIKLDGYRMQLRVDGRRGRHAHAQRSRLDRKVRGRRRCRRMACPDCIIDGEVCALDHNGAPDFAALQAALSEGRSQDLTYFVFDLLFEGAEDLRRMPLTERKERLRKVLSRKGSRMSHISGMSSTSPSPAMPSSSRPATSISKASSPSAPVRHTSPAAPRPGHKSKCRGGQEVVIGGWSGSSNNLRSLLVGVYRGDHLVHTGRVGTGFNQRNAGNLLKKLNALKTDRSPFGGKGAPRKGKDWNWVKPKLVAEIEFAGWTGDGNVRQAAFKGLREDKPAGEVRAEASRRQRKRRSCRHPRRRRAATASRAAAKLSWALSSLSPTSRCGREPEAYTKLDLAQYLEKVGPWMIEHLKGRPCSIIRAPDGINGERFFQRHEMKGHVEPAFAREGRGRPQALHPDRPHRRPDRRRADRRHRIPPLEQPAATSQRSRAGWCSTSIPRPMFPSTP